MSVREKLFITSILKNLGDDYVGQPVKSENGVVVGKVTKTRVDRECIFVTIAIDKEFVSEFKALMFTNMPISCEAKDSLIIKNQPAKFKK